MISTETDLLDILRLGHQCSIRGAGLSLSRELQQTFYKERRSGFGPADLRPLIAAQPELMQQWFAYSEDKRTAGGWYIVRSGEIGQVSDPPSRIQYDSLPEAVAEYVVRELDFWANLEGKS